MTTPNNMWGAASPHPHSQSAGQPAGGDDMGLQVRPMGLKVHYTFDRDGQIKCLARWQHILPIQTMPVDERNSIGVVDLRTCLQAIAQCSPEIVNQQESDYTVYAYDYSEPDLPLVGQGMLSWGLEYHMDQQQQQQQQQQLVTGRVTRNLMSIMNNGSRETLEVKLKLTAVAKMQRNGFSTSLNMEAMNMIKSAPTPADTTSSEWNSFIQSNPMLGHSGNVASMPSPSLPPAQLNNSFSDARVDYTQQQFRPSSRPSSVPPVNNIRPAVSNTASLPTPVQTIGIRPAGPTESLPSPAASQPKPAIAEQPARASRPSSRASRSRVPTGRPRGRPRKNPEPGNTSAAEEATDGDDGPQKKRAKITKAEYSTIAPFGSAPESLRVTASTSGSLRNMRPVGAVGDGPGASHVQDIPRAPTPIPDAPLLKKQVKRRAADVKTRSDSAVDMESSLPYNTSRLGQSSMQRSMSMDMDARSPSESIAQSPDQCYTPDDSPADLGSSPPVPRTSAYLQSSPMASSPILPTMPLPQVDSGFMSGGIDDFFDPEDNLQELPQPLIDGQSAAVAPMPQASKPTGLKNGAAPKQQRQQPNFAFHEVNPGPPELLPTKSIFNPVGKVRTLNRPPPATSVPPLPKKTNSRSLKRSNTAPSPNFSEQEAPVPVLEQQAAQPPAFDQPANQEPVLELLRDEGDQQTTIQPQDSQSEEQLPASNSQDIPRQSLEDEVVDVIAEPNQPDPQQMKTAASVPDAMPVDDVSAQNLPTAEPVLALAGESTSRPASRPASRDASNGPPTLTVVPASDPAPEPALTLPRAFMSEAPCPASDCLDQPYNKNQVKKQTIKERLENAIQKGESPPFCKNCGAIETPTWRKIWTQNHQGIPGFHEFSDKPGFVTMIDILERDSEGQPAAYQLVKKNLGPKDNKKVWKETLLCNPCGIWLAKFKGHRPPDRWDKDAARLNQPRKKREAKGSNPRSKKSRTKSSGQMNPTSEACFPTDPLGPLDQEQQEDGGQSRRQSTVAAEQNNDQNQTLDNMFLNSRSSSKQRGPGSTHSRGSGTADSPVAVQDDLGATRRILFQSPGKSPGKDGAPKVLGELEVNVVQTATVYHDPKSTISGGKENGNPIPPRPATPVLKDHELEQELFGTPPARPSTPPPKTTSSGPVFKTPTRPTPSHRPITRSISRSIRTVTSIPKSPSQFLAQIQRTPSKTPRSATGSNALLFSAGGGSKRRSPRNAQLHPHFVLDEDMHNGHFDSPFTATLNQLLSEANDFTSGSPSHGLVDLDLTSLPNLDSDDLTQHLTSTGALDFGNFLSTDLIMPSSPPLLRNHGGGLGFGASLGGYHQSNSADGLWAQMSATGMLKEGELEGGQEMN
ncbi:hypothetical protein B0T22DRAFT_236473 [Podospora appendiculata]|uniref:Ams2/SPT21 N-terminal domain-containing protein n=1 Tax=Podospora appendiculata TaxID=314037 RepID=A0AAE1CAY1_9PEZI|nr:hypothetical protein B0T22DRAFT_236473 [Podospora appendiculata]